MSLFRKDPALEAGEALYAAAVEQARTPVLYADFGVPDTVEGRFEMVALHVYLVLRRLKEDAPGAKKVGQKLFDVMFQDMDHSLRELGVGDLSVAKKIRKMAENFYGRIGAYEDGLKKGEPAEAAGDDLASALARNVFGDDEPARARALAAYVRSAAAATAAQPITRVVGGVVRFPDAEPVR